MTEQYCATPTEDLWELATRYREDWLGFAQRLIQTPVCPEKKPQSRASFRPRCANSVTTASGRTKLGT